MTDLKGSFRAGAATFRAKLPASTNPHPPGSENHGAWLNGYRCELADWLLTPDGEAFMALVYTNESEVTS